MHNGGVEIQMEKGSRRRPPLRDLCGKASRREYGSCIVVVVAAASSECGGKKHHQACVEGQAGRIKKPWAGRG